MDKELIQTIKKEIKNQSWDYWKNKKLTDFLREKQIAFNKEDLYELTKQLIEEDIFGFLFAISNSLLDLATDDDSFIDLLVPVIKKIKYDLTQGPFIDSLIELSRSNPELGLNIAKKLMKIEDVVEYSSYLIGSAYKGLQKESNSIIDELFSSDNPSFKVTGIRALRVIYKNSRMENKDKVFSILEKTSQNNSKEVKLELQQAFLDFYEYDNERCKTNIESLVRTNTDCKFNLAHRIWIKSPLNDETSLELLQICSEDSNINVKKYVCYALTRFVEKHPEKILEIIASYIIRDGFDFGDMGFTLEELGKVNASKALTIILDWLIKNRNPRLSFHVPVMINSLVAKIDKKIILNPLFETIESNPQLMDKLADVLLEIISSSYPQNVDNELLSQTVSFLEKQANKMGIDVTSLKKSELDKTLLCGDLIHMIKYYSKPLDYDTIFKNLNEFTNIHDLFGLSWFEKKKAENNRTHPILKILGRKLPEEQKLEELAKNYKNAENERDEFNHFFRLKNLVSDMLFLKNLDSNIYKLKKAGINLGSYADNLRNEQQFFATLSEIDFVCPFLFKCNLELEPKVKTKKLDVKLEIDAQTLYIEIISPVMFKPLDRLSGARGIPNRAKDKIYDEFKHQLKELTAIQQPAIVAIDISRSEIGYNFVEDYLFGTLKFVWHIDSVTHETVGTQVIRDEKESMHQLEANMDLISAVICYKTQFYDDFTYRTEGKIFENPNATVPLSRSVRKKIEEILFSA